MNLKLRFLFAFALVFSVKYCFAQNSFYNIDTIQVIEITFAQSNWDYQLDTAKAGSDGYILASQVKINGTVFANAGVRYKGNSSYDSTSNKNPLHIKLDYVTTSASYDGYSEVKLSNCYSDPSMIREVLAYDILGNYMAAPKSNFARIIINGVYYGVYSNNQSIGKDFLNRSFYSSTNSLFKCNPASILNGHIPNLVYLGTDSANYYDRYELKTATPWKDLIDLCDTIVNQPAYIDSVIDVDRAIWMLAFNNETVNLDSYSGAFAQNYYLYKDDNGRYDPIIWDLNMCFGGFTNSGLGNLNITGMQQMTPILHSTNGARPLIMNILANPTYFKMYIAHLRTINDEFFLNGAYLTLAQNMQTLIDSSAQADTCSSYSYTQFQQGLTTNVSTIPGVSVLMSARSSYLSTTSQFQQIPPTISNVISSPTSVTWADTIWINAFVSNTTNVLLGYRSVTSQIFHRINMFDDGLHHDGIAGDSIFGAFMIPGSLQMEYYVYAENANAGMFSPERAEYEFYSIPVLMTGIPENNLFEYAISCFPNPSNAQVTIVSSHPAVHHVDLINPAGQLIETKEFENGRAELNVETFSAGIYFYQTKNKNGTVLKTGKIAIIR